MKTKLKPYTFNAKKWRIENGFTTPEWEMYVDNAFITTVFIVFFSILTGILIGVGIRL